MQLVPAQQHTPMPSLDAERPFAEQLARLRFPTNLQPHVWYARIPGVRDTDAILWVPETGLFVIEMKSYPLSGIVDVRSDRLELLSYLPQRDETPWDQVISAMFQVKNRLFRDSVAARTLGWPWITPVAALFRIRRADFRSRWVPEREGGGDAEFARDLLNGMMFEEDLESGETFLSALASIRRHPIRGYPPRKPNSRVAVPDAVEALDRFIRPRLREAAPASAYDRHRVSQLEKESERDLEALGTEGPVVCSGYAGTGKTFLGLGAALRLLETRGAAARGLYVCYNKVLSTDVHRLVQLSQRFQNLRFAAHDSFALLREVSKKLGFALPPPGDDYDEWAARVVAQIRSVELPRHSRWDIVVVDEAQDLQDWMWSLLRHLADSGARLFVIDGKNQSLYREDRPGELDAVVAALRTEGPKANLLQRRRVFRTTDATFLVSQLFAEAYPSIDAAERVWERRLKPGRDRALRAEAARAEQAHLELPGFELVRQGGRAPRLYPLRGADAGAALEHVRELLRTGYAKTREYYHENLPSSVLILVPSASVPGSGELNWAELARRACQEEDLRYIDYTDDAQKRITYAGDEVRICTFHSSRGVEGLHTIVLGFDRLFETAQTQDWRTGNLGYIVLSRSVYDTDVVYVERSQWQRKEVGFLQAALSLVGL